MTLKGDYSGAVTYAVGDVVRYQDAGYMAKEETEGVPPTVDRVWQRLDQSMWDVVDMIIDMISSRITEESIALKGENGDYLITVDDSGDSPELDITAIEE